MRQYCGEWQLMRRGAGDVYTYKLVLAEFFPDEYPGGQLFSGLRRLRGASGSRAASFDAAGRSPLEGI